VCNPAGIRLSLAFLGGVKFTMVSLAAVERILAFLGPGAIVGELAIVDGQPRSASVVAVREAR
jgi:CRP/FNR family transcriptional regulator, cyclic AMP receptor protein